MQAAPEGTRSVRSRPCATPHQWRRETPVVSELITAAATLATARSTARV